MALKTVKSGLASSFSHLNAKRSSKERKNVLNHKSILRIVDANSNRCREGLRVVEDSLRFVLNDGNLYKKIRTIRHSVDKISRNIYGDLIKERDSFDDLGRKIPEVSKKDLQDVMIANFKRVQESLRVLEEYSKTFVPLASTEFKKQRYNAYVLEKEVYLKYKRVFLVKEICNIS
jgi:thiamine-phosphate pyrophosphorylase